MSILKKLRERTEPLNVGELARLLDVTEATIQRWVRRHQVPAIRIGDVIRFDPGMLADWIDLQAAASQRRHEFINVLIRASEARELNDFQMRRTDFGEEHSEEIPPDSGKPAT